MNLPSLSICIPVKDFDVRPLVASLLTELRNTPTLRAEILILEDGSSETSRKQNLSLQKEPEVRLLSFEENKGRSAARNFMAKQAEGEYLLFIDADSLPVSPRYIHLYLEHHRPDAIIAGGTHYSELYRKPGSHLHWKFGVHREVADAVKNKKRSFHSNNFMMATAAFERIRFDETLVLYGHEDTLFGFVARASGLQIVYTDNPVIHTCLENNEAFLNKTDESIRSLMTIMQRKHLYPSGIEKEFRLWNTYKKMKSIKLLFLLTLFIPFHSLIRRTLFLLSGPLLLYDLYRLVLLHRQSILVEPRHK